MLKTAGNTAIGVKNMNGPKDSYASMFDNALVSKAAKDPKVFYPLRPSSAGKCSRILAHELMAYMGYADALKEEKSGRMERLLNTGHYIEEQMVANAKLVPGFDVRFTQQVVDLFALPSGRVVEGSIDLALWNDTTKCVMDIKTVGDRWHNVFATKWDGMAKDYARICTTLEDTKDRKAFYIEDLEDFLNRVDKSDSLYDNLQQLNAYCCSEFFQSRGVDHGVVLRVRKNDSAQMEIRFKPNRRVFEALKAKFSAIEDAVLKHKNPDLLPRDHLPGIGKCHFSPYSHLCTPHLTRAEKYAQAPKKNWAVKVSELEKASEVATLLQRRAVAEQAAKDLKALDNEILLLMDGHGVTKIKADNGDVYDYVSLSKGVELRRGKE